LEIEASDQNARVAVCMPFRMMLHHHTRRERFEPQIAEDCSIVSIVMARATKRARVVKRFKKFFARIRKNSIAMSKKPGYSCRSSHPESL